MSAFGKRGVAPELAQSPSLIVRREDKAFDADHKKSVSRIILVRLPDYGHPQFMRLAFSGVDWMTSKNTPSFQ